MIVCITCYILVYLHFENKKEAKYARWRLLSSSLITQSIFFEPEKDAETFKVPQRINKLLSNPYFRKFLTNEILSSSENITGISGNNLKTLYLELGLDSYALKLLNSKPWHKIASGIKEIGMMELDAHKNKIEHFTNHKRGLIRLEAQNTILKFNNFLGLDFLDTVLYPITEWQQIKLLEHLAKLPPEDFTGIEKWLASKNDTVVIFALKLCRNYHRFEIHDEVANCLQHSNPQIRGQTILTLKEIPTEHTASKLIAIYTDETKKNKLLIINALKEIGSTDEIAFLTVLLDDEDIDIKAKVADTLASILPNGFKVLCSHSSAESYPLNEIISSLKSQRDELV